MNQNQHPDEMAGHDQLTDPEKRFLKRVAAKYTRKQDPIYRSLAVISAAILAAHLIERSNLPWWIALPLIYCPAIWLFYRYRRFAIFKTRLMCKMVRKLGLD
jgi:hypothetical protein